MTGGVMNVVNSLQMFRDRLLEPRSWEQDPRYTEALSKISRRGLFAAGTLALMGLVAYLATGLLILGRTPMILPPATPSADANVMVMWDKILVLAAGVTFLLASRGSARLHWGRVASAVVIIILTAASVIDEIVGGVAIEAASVYPTVYLLVVAVAIPYRPLQMLSLSALTYVVVALCEVVLPPLLGISVSGSTIGQLPFMFIATGILSGISLLLSSTRHDQYLAIAAAQQLAEELETRAQELQAAKDRADDQAAKLVEAEHLKDRFFGNISHEFRTPLTLIMGPVDDALGGAYGQLRPAMAEMLGGVMRSSERLLMLVNDLLDLSRLDADRIRLNLEQHDLVEFLKLVVHHFVDLAGRRNVTLTYQTALDDLSVSFDQNALEKVVYNLLSNAFKFVPDGGAVMIKLEAVSGRSGPSARITVKDNGPGIDPVELPLIWDRFHRVETQGWTDGSGVGLALVKELVELQGGSVGVRSDPGFGSEFFVMLPLADSTAVAEVSRSLVDVDLSMHGVLFDDEADEDLPENGRPRAPIVLIVENDQDVRAYVRRHLRALYRVREARDGVEALESIREERPALVISDVMMPRMDGMELCRKIKKDPDLADIPVVLLTARADEEDELEGLEAGADDYIPKPFKSAALVARVENLIELRRMLLQRYTEGVVDPTPLDVPSVDQSFMERVKTTVEEHIGDSQFGVEWLADEVGLSARQLQRRIRAITRLSAAGYIRLMRLKRAAQLLAGQAGNVSEVAYAVGFRDSAYFSRLFKQTFKMLPSEYIEQHSPAGGNGEFVDS